MIPYLGLLVSLVFSICFSRFVEYSVRFDWQKGKIDEAMERDAGLSSEEIKERRKDAHEHYRDAMADYDKSLVWAAGGTLAASYAIYGVLVGDETPKDVHYLALGWVILVVAVFIRIGSPYAATRNFAKTTEVYRLLGDSDTDMNKVRAERTLAFRYGRLTKYFNELGMFALFNSIYLIGLFVSRNLPSR